MEIKNNFSLKSFNTFGIDVKTNQFIEIQSSEELKELFHQFKSLKNDNKFLVLGEGSNILFTNDYDGIILHNKIKGIKIIEETDESVFIQVGGGEKWSDFVDYTVNKGWWGLENLSLIPGTVGAAPVQNIGAYGVEQRESLDYLQAFNMETGVITTFFEDECIFGYRSSIFKTLGKGKWFILNATYRLTKQPNPKLNYGKLQETFHGRDYLTLTPSEISTRIKEIRREKLPDPQQIGNAGSFFKNPIINKIKLEEIKRSYQRVPFYIVDENRIKIPAGWLIEQCGWKGKKHGNAGVYPKQALVLINTGNATGSEILNLANLIKKDVYEHFKIDLEPEVTIL